MISEQIEALIAMRKAELELAFTEVGRHYCGIGTDSATFREAVSRAYRIKGLISELRTAATIVKALEAKP